MKKFKYIFVVALIVALASSYSIAYYVSAETVEVTIKDKERITTGSGENISSKFIVYTQDEVFENTDSTLFLKFDSSDLQNELTPSNTYKVKVAGWRIPVVPSYRNILSVE
jgi:hypothetical protein